MSVRKEAWTEGTPSWVELMVPDLESAKAFYTGLFGWEYNQGGEEYGNYAVAVLDGEPVAGLGPMQGPDGQPPAWMTYLEASDLQVAVDRVTAAGGSVVAPPMPVGEFGSLAMAADPTGAVFGLWKSGQHTGINRYNEPGSFVWAEAMVSDFTAAQAFYAAVFGYQYDAVEPGLNYSVINLDGRPVAGLGDLALTDSGLPSHWRVYFAVGDIADTVARVTELGGRVLAEPWDTPFGQMASVSGRAGEVFHLNQPPSS
jgi:uncharacterized protein